MEVEALWGSPTFCHLLSKASAHIVPNSNYQKSKIAQRLNNIIEDY